MWDYKAESNNEQTRKINKQKLTDADNSKVATRGKGMKGVIKVVGVKYMVMQEELTLGSGHTMQYTGRPCTIELYPRNLYDLINQHHPNKFNLKRKRIIFTQKRLNEG